LCSEDLKEEVKKRPYTLVDKSISITKRTQDALAYGQLVIYKLASRKKQEMTPRYISINLYLTREALGQSTAGGH